MTAATPVTVWVDPSCPWAWQAHVWLRELERLELVDLSYAFFSLELHAHGLDDGFAAAAPRYGHAIAALALARREAGHRAAGDLYVELGTRLHERKEEMRPSLVADATDAAGLPGLADRASADDLDGELIDEYHTARALDVFGVPTLQIADGKTMYGPILAVGPTGEDAVDLWHTVEALLRRDTFFELKRWPRDVRPGGAPTGPS